MPAWDAEAIADAASERARGNVVSMMTPTTAELRSIADRLQRDVDRLQRDVDSYRGAVDEREAREALARTIGEASAVLARSVESMNRDEP